MLVTSNDGKYRGIFGWLAGGGFAVIATILGIYTGTSKIKADYESEIEATVQQSIEFTRVANDAKIGADFAHCWPTSSCPGLEALPIDEDQNGRIDALESQLTGLVMAFRNICQGLRDKDKAENGSEKWPDCARLGL